MLNGKGIWIRRIAECEHGDLDAIVAKAQAAAFQHVILKIADGADVYNVDRATGHDAAAELTRRLSAAGITVWGWHAVYGDKPLFKGTFQPDYHLREARCAAQRIAELTPAGLQGCVLNAEGDYERAASRAHKAAEFMRVVRESHPGLLLALASWKYPNAHARFPWKEFRGECDLDMPQVFWIGQHGEAQRQLEASIRQFAALQPRLPYVPSGPAFFEGNWRPAPEEMVTFLEKAIALGLPAANLWDWDELALLGDESYNPGQLDFTAHWKAVAAFVWSEPVATPFWMRAPEPAEAPAAEVLPFVSPEPQPEAEREPSVPASIALEPLPDWLTQPEEEFPAEPAFEVEAVPEEVEAAPETAAIGEPGVEPALEAPVGAPSEPELPEHRKRKRKRKGKKDRVQAPQVAAQAPEPEPAPAVAQPPEPQFAAEGIQPLDLEPEGELPAWLQFLNEPQVPAEHLRAPEAALSPAAPAPEPLAAPPPGLEPLPDWLQQPAADLARAMGPLPPPELVVPSPIGAEPLPDWLKQPAAELARAVAPITAHEAELEFTPLSRQLDLEPEDELPEWLQFLNEPAPAIEVAVPQPEARPLAAPPPSLEPLPDWLQQPAADLARAMGPLPPPELVVPSPIGAEPLPDWLKQPAADLARAVAPEAPGAAKVPEREAVTEVAITQAEAAALFAPASSAAVEAPPAATRRGTSPGETVQWFFEDLRRGRPEEVVALYGPSFALISSERVERDPSAVFKFYERLLQRLDRRTLNVLSLRGSRAAVSARWAARTPEGASLQGTDTFHLNREGQIVYHHTTFLS